MNLLWRGFASNLIHFCSLSVLPLTLGNSTHIFTNLHVCDILNSFFRTSSSVWEFQLSLFCVILWFCVCLSTGLGCLARRCFAGSFPMWWECELRCPQHSSGWPSLRSSWCRWKMKCVHGKWCLFEFFASTEICFLGNQILTHFLQRIDLSEERAS